MQNGGLFAAKKANTLQLVREDCLAVRVSDGAEMLHIICIVRSTERMRHENPEVGETKG